MFYQLAYIHISIYNDVRINVTLPFLVLLYHLLYCISICVEQFYIKLNQVKLNYI